MHELRKTHSEQVCSGDPRQIMYRYMILDVRYQIVTPGSSNLRPGDHVDVWIVDLISFLMQPIQRASECEEVFYIVICCTPDMSSGLYLP